MTSFLGMDPQEVRTFASQLTNDADEIERIANTLTSQLGNVPWVGADATNFRNDWNGTLRSQLNSVANALRDASSCANSNASQQEQASA